MFLKSELAYNYDTKFQLKDICIYYLSSALWKMLIFVDFSSVFDIGHFSEIKHFVIFFSILSNNSCWIFLAKCYTTKEYVRKFAFKW